MKGVRLWLSLLGLDRYNFDNNELNACPRQCQLQWPVPEHLAQSCLGQRHPERILLERPSLLSMIHLRTVRTALGLSWTYLVR